MSKKIGWMEKAGNRKWERDDMKKKIRKKEKEERQELGDEQLRKKGEEGEKGGRNQK